jgi:DNA-binding MarR family transcriptional regulator
MDVADLPGDDYASEVFHRFLRIQRFLRQHALQMNNQGISPRDYAALRFLLETGPATVGQIQTYLHKSPSTISTLLAHLEEQGYLSRTRSQEDNRVVIVDLTTAGRDIAQYTPLGGLPLLRHQLRQLSRERLARIDSALYEIMELMQVPETDELA